MTTGTFVVTGGNPNLKPETAKNLTVGAVFTPSFVPRLSLTVDFYKLTKKDIIGTADFDYIILQNALGTAYIRAASSPNPDNTILELQATRDNLLEQSIQGIDIGAEYTTPEASWGQLNLRADVTYLSEFQAVAGAEPARRSSGSAPIPRRSARWRAGGPPPRDLVELVRFALDLARASLARCRNDASLLVNGKQALCRQGYLQHRHRWRPIIPS